MALRILMLGGLLVSLAFIAANVSAEEAVDAKSATFSICAIDPENGLCGAAVASKYPAVGGVVPYVRAGVGAFCTQHYHVPAWGEKSLDLLEQGKSPAQVLVELLVDDAKPEQRQLAMIDMQGRSALHSPTAASTQSDYWGAATGKKYCVQGNTLAGREVIVEMSRAFEETKGSLADRLLASLLAGDLAGGDHRGRLAAGIRIAKQDVKDYWLELYVDDSTDAVTELVGKYADLKHAGRGEWNVREALEKTAVKRSEK